jgi:hypothetical protein
MIEALSLFCSRKLTEDFRVTEELAGEGSRLSWRGVRGREVGEGMGFQDKTKHQVKQEPSVPFSKAGLQEAGAESTVASRDSAPRRISTV